MVLNIGEEDLSRRDNNEDSSDHRCSPAPSDSNSPSYNSHYNRNGYSHRDRYENNHERNLNGGNVNNENTSSEAPLDFSIRRRYSSNHDEEEIDMKESEDIKPPLSPTDSEVGSINGVSSPTLERRRRQDNNVNHYESKVGEPKLALPGLLPISTMANPYVMPPGFPPGFLPNMGMLGPLPPLVIDPNTHNQQVNADQNGKSNRPFKSYPKDPLGLPMGYFGMPGAPPLPGMDLTKAQTFPQEEMMKRYKEYVTFLQESQRQMTVANSSVEDNSSKKVPKSNRQSYLASPPHNRQMSSTHSPPVCSPNTPSPATSEISTQQNHTSLPNANQNDDLNDSFNNEYSNGHSPQMQQSSNSRKRSRLLPENCKDASYWERRRKNNEAAKRSRDARRAKEDEIAIRAAFLEQENLKLRVEVAALKNETAKLRCMLYNS